MAVPPANSGLGDAAPPRLAKASRKTSIFALARTVGPLEAKCIPCSPAHCEPMALDEPYQKAGSGCCNGRKAMGTSL